MSITTCSCNNEIDLILRVVSAYLRAAGVTENCEGVLFIRLSRVLINYGAVNEPQGRTKSLLHTALLRTNLTVALLMKKLPSFYGTRRFITVLITVHHKLSVIKYKRYSRNFNVLTIPLARPLPCQGLSRPTSYLRKFALYHALNFFNFATITAIF